MAEPSMIIIGAGLAGLSTGCYARMNGYAVRIFEQHSKPGGQCTAWRRGDFTFDGCIHWLMGASPDAELHQIYRELGVPTAEAFFRLDRYLRVVDEASGAAVTFGRDLDRLEADLVATFPQDRKPIAELVRAVKKLRGVPMPVLKPSSVLGPLETVQQLWSMRRLLAALIGPLGKPVRAYAARFSDPVLRKSLMHLFGPDIPTSFSLYILACLADGSLAGYRGGSLAFSRAIEGRYLALGGEVSYRAPVAKILVESGRAVGVRLADGSEQRADVVVSTADGRATLFDMLEGRYLDAATRKRYERWPIFPPLVMVSFGVANPLGAGTAPTVTLLKDPIRHAGRTIDALHFRTFHEDPSLAPAGKSVVQVALQDDWDFWAALVADRPAYDAAKQALADAVQEKLYPHLPGLRGKIEVTDVATPYTTWRYTRVHRGAYEGWLPTPEVVRGGALPRTMPGLKGFYMAGQWVEPGGGIPPALYSGRHLLQILCKEQRKKFQAWVGER